MKKGRLQKDPLHWENISVFYYWLRVWPKCQRTPLRVQLYMYKQSYECIILNLSFPHWSTKKIMTVYLYKHRYFFFKYPTQYYVRSKNGIFQPISTKCRLGTKCRSNADWGLSTKHRLRRRSPSAEIREIYFCSWNGPKISYIKVAGWSPYIIARNAIKSKKAN